MSIIISELTRSRKGRANMASKHVIKPSLPNSVSKVTTSKSGSVKMFLSVMNKFFLS